MNEQNIFIGCVALYVLAAAATDICARKIPNALTVTAAVAGLLFHATTSGWGGVLTSLGGFVIGFSLLLAPFALGGGGGGDVKLLAALGAWLGPVKVILAFCGGIGFGALFAAMVLGSGFVTQGMSETRAKLKAASGRVDAKGIERSPERRSRNRVLPFAVPVALSTFALLGWSMVKSGLGI